MDCFSAESEFIESLDFLSPPVKRLHNSREVFGSTYRNELNDVHLLRGLRNKFARREPSSTRNTRTVKTNAESSTSLILKKTSERQILEHYSIVSYTSLQHTEDDSPSVRKSDKSPNPAEKPLIKVTVIPKTDQIQTAKILRKRRYIPKKVQSTSSNHENSVQTKNVYLIVAGRRREKIYEIKTTGSATFSTDHDSYSKDDEIPVKEISNFKHLIQSLNMDRKKKKGKQIPIVNANVPQQTSFEWPVGYEDAQDCQCTIEHKNESGMPKKSRVRIFGQFGISEDDKYVLRYGASVNDKQILSDVAQLTQDFTPVLGPVTKYGTAYYEDPERQKDSCIQADCANEFDNGQQTLADTVPSKESQGTQVNFNIQIASMATGKTSKYSDKKIQCSCCAVTNRSDHKSLKECQSPLVIISVYPKQSPEDITKAKELQSPTENINFPSGASRMNTYTSNQVLKIDTGTKRSNNETKLRTKGKNLSVSRSPSPVKKPSRSKLQEDKLIETRMSKAKVAERRSPDRQKALASIKEKIREKDKLKRDVSPRQPSKFITSSAPPVPKNMQKTTVSNGTQVSNKSQQQITASNGTQLSARNRQNYTVSNASQYSKNPQNLRTTNATQSTKSPHRIITGVKHTPNIIAPIKHAQSSYISNTTQVSKTPHHFIASNATQVSNNKNSTTTNATQVSKNRQMFNSVSQNQQTYAAPIATQVNLNKESPTLLANLQERGTNTEHAQAKKALVETYTKKLTEQMNQKDIISPKFDGSKITINIDGDKEYYDVLLNQDKLSTDLTIRKKYKDMCSQKGYEDECSASMENVFYLPECAEGKGGLFCENKSPTKSMSIALYNNRSDDELPVMKHVSRVTIRDSLEISHRREDKSNLNNIKNTQTCFTAQFADNIPDESEFLAPIKHYTGDDCSLGDPMERDKQIRELLGVEKSKVTFSKNRPAQHSENDGHFPYECIYRQECKKSQVTEINFQFQKLCPCLKSNSHTKGKSVQCASVQCKNNKCRAGCHPKPNNYGYAEEEEDGWMEEQNDFNQTYGVRETCCVNPLRYSSPERSNEDEEYGGEEGFVSPDNYDKYNSDPCNQNENQNDYNETDASAAGDTNKKAAIYQQLILNRNIQVFLQVEQFSKQKPIILSRKQYNKVKKTIQKTICKKKSSHDKRKKFVCNKCERSEVSVGVVRKKRAKDTRLLIDQEAQTDLAPCSKENCRKDRKKIKSKNKTKAKHSSADQSEDLSGDRVTTRSPSIFRRRSTEQRRKTQTTEQNETHRTSGSRNKGRSSERRSDIKSKRKVDQNVEVVTIDQYSGNHSMLSEQNIEGNGVHIGDRIGERKVDRIGERKVELIGNRNVGRIGEHNVGRYNKRNVESSADQHNEQKRDRSLRYNKQRRERSPERYSGQKREHSPEQYSDENEESSLERHIVQRRSHSPDQCSDEEGNCNPDRHSGRKGSRSPEQYSDPNEDQIDNGAIERRETEVKTLVLFNAGKGHSKDPKETDALTRKTVSSVEIRYASVAYMKQIAYSSTDVGALSDSSLAHVNSFHTIFRGHRKSPTPNLGTSAYSLYSEDGFNSDNRSAKFIMEPRDSKPRKPFLRRLMSCLVMRSTRESELKIPACPAPDLPSVNSSIDSYHISTSLGAVEVSSSIYDTSASFYSNHTILPVNSKIKRGFFSSVRGFLTNRKS